MATLNTTMVAFSWIIPDRLAGAGRPGLVRAPERDMRTLRKQGFGLVVTLTEEPLEVSPADFDMRGIYFPIKNMGVPDLDDLDAVCYQIISAMDAGEGVLVHCRSGLGRTGMMLACTLVALGSEPDHAVRTLRAIQRDYVQSRGQEQLIQTYAQFVKEQGYARRHLDTVTRRLVDAGASSSFAELAG